MESFYRKMTTSGGEAREEPVKPLMDTLEAYQRALSHTMLFVAINRDQREVTMKMPPLVARVRRSKVVGGEEGVLCVDTLEELGRTHARADQRVGVAQSMVGIARLEERIAWNIVGLGDRAKRQEVTFEERTLCRGRGVHGLEHRLVLHGEEGVLEVEPEPAKQGEEADVRIAGQPLVEVFEHERVDVEGLMRLTGDSTQAVERAFLFGDTKGCMA